MCAENAVRLHDTIGSHQSALKVNIPRTKLAFDHRYRRSSTLRIGERPTELTLTLKDKQKSDERQYQKSQD